MSINNLNMSLFYINLLRSKLYLWEKFCDSLAAKNPFKLDEFANIQ